MVPFVAMADNERLVKRVEAVHVKIISDVKIHPACPVMFVKRKKRITPIMLCTHGRKTPLIVPSFRDDAERERPG
jgi:hypothetical protein